MTKIRYEVDWWKEGFGLTSMRFDNQREAFELAKEIAKTTITFLRKMTWINDELTTEQVKINTDGTWE